MLATSPTTRASAMAIAGGILVFLSVAAELVYPVQDADGTSREPAIHALYLAVWAVGIALIAAMALGLRARFAQGEGSRKGTVGCWLVVAGAAAFAVFGLGQLFGILFGVDVEALFVLFLLAFPLLVVGFVLIGLAMRRAGGWGWILAFVAAAGFLLALLAEMDPWHDIGFLTGALAVAAFGCALNATGPRTMPGS
jgi:hypothetical protein